MNHGFAETAREGRNRWLDLNDKVFKATGKMMGKYNVVDAALTTGGGEYPNQDGFGWTNGVYLAMDKDRRSERVNSYRMASLFRWNARPVIHSAGNLWHYICFGYCKNLPSNLLGHEKALHNCAGSRYDNHCFLPEDVYSIASG